MKEYHFNDLTEGLEESFSYIVTAEKMSLFCSLTGDENPLHMEETFAVEHGFLNRVVYGMLTASLISTLAGMYLPGKYCLIQEVDSKFVSPVYIGDELLVKGVVRELSESVQQAVIKVEITNQNHKKVVRGTLKVGFLE